MSMRECKKCGKQPARYATLGLCNACYVSHRRKSNKGKFVCVKCNRDNMEYGSRGMCISCYTVYCKTNKSKQVCISCDEVKYIYAKEMCNNCYNKYLRIKNSKDFVCSECGKSGDGVKVYGKGMCAGCYRKYRIENTMEHRECLKCRKIGPIAARGYCFNCYRTVNSIENGIIEHERVYGDDPESLSMDFMLKICEGDIEGLDAN